MDGRIVNHQCRWPRQFRGKAVDACDRDARINGSLENIRIKRLAIVTQKAQHVELGTPAARDFNTFAHPLPAIRNARRQRESRLIKIEQVLNALLHQLLNFCQRFLCRKSFLVPLAAKRLAHSLPDKSILFRQTL